ncbi:MAG: prolyl oligopeptidase family serine peptidase, partial [Bacteroidales bacterium]|nr:prolyl oligopeptidase family serine peptidase [Bacteroidales bacterium]
MNAKKGYIGRTELKTERFTPEVLLALGRISDPQLSPDGNFFLYGVSYNSIEENRSCRNIFIASVDGATIEQLTFDGKSISNARFCDGGGKIIFVQDGQIWCAPLRGSQGHFSLGKRVRLSNVPNGVSEFALSPDESKIMYVSTVKSKVKSPADVYPELDKATAYSTDDLMYRHWDHWKTELPHTYVADIDFTATDCVVPDSSADILGPEGALFELPIEPFGGVEQLAWSPDSKYIAYSCKKLTGKEYAFSTDTEIYIYNVATGVSALIPFGGGYDTDPVWSPDGSQLCWVSMERNGYEADKERLIVAMIDPVLLGMATSPQEPSHNLPVLAIDVTAEFKYNVASPVWGKDGKIWFNSLCEGVQAVFCAEINTASRTNAMRRANPALPSNPWVITRYTNEKLWYDFDTPFGFVTDGNGGEKMLVTRCSMLKPVEIVAVALEPDATECDILTHENDHLLADLKEPTMEARYIKTVDGKDMLTWVLYPPEFDANKVYPAIEITLGGPQSTNSQTWSYRWCYRLMAEEGYIVALPNRRGTTAFGQEWTEQISGDYIGLNMQDYLVTAKALKAEPYIGKLAACGASYGGYSVYYLAGIHEGIFDCFIAHAGIFNEAQLYYTTE